MNLDYRATFGFRMVRSGRLLTELFLSVSAADIDALARDLRIGRYGMAGLLDERTP